MSEQTEELTSVTILFWINDFASIDDGWMTYFTVPVNQGQANVSDLFYFSTQHTVLLYIRLILSVFVKSTNTVPPKNTKSSNYYRYKNINYCSIDITDSIFTYYFKLLI